MSFPGQDDFEQELKRLQPAPLPAALQRRIESSMRVPGSRAGVMRRPGRISRFWRTLAIPAAAAAIIVFLSVLLPKTAESFSPDTIAVEQHLLSVGRDGAVAFPTGDAISFARLEWVDHYTLTDHKTATQVQHAVVRVELVPVALAIY